MSQMDRIERQNDRIIQLLETLTGQQLPGAGGVTCDADGTPFLPGTGRLGGSGAHHPEDEEPATADPAERARILETVRAARRRDDNDT